MTLRGQSRRSLLSEILYPARARLRQLQSIPRPHCASGGRPGRASKVNRVRSAVLSQGWLSEASQIKNQVWDASEMRPYHFKRALSQIRRGNFSNNAE